MCLPAAVQPPQHEGVPSGLPAAQCRAHPCAHECCGLRRAKPTMHQASDAQRYVHDTRQTEGATPSSSDTFGRVLMSDCSMQCAPPLPPSTPSRCLVRPPPRPRSLTQMPGRRSTAGSSESALEESRRAIEPERGCSRRCWAISHTLCMCHNRLEHELLTLYPKKVEVVHALEPYVDAQVR